jgi:integrase
MGRLSVAGIRNLKPAEKPYKMFDGRGLYLEVYPNGSKLWRIKYRLAGRESRVSLGRFPEVGLSEARDRTGLIRSGLRRGDSPVRPKRSILFGDVAKEWFGRNYADKRPSTIKNMRSALDRTILPALGHCPIREITRELVIERLLKPMEGHAPKSRNMLCVCGKIFEHAILRGDADVNVPEAVKGFIPEHAVKHVPAIVSGAEIGRLVNGIHRLPDDVHKTLLRLYGYLFVRRGELLNAEWDELDFGNALWTIPAARMKANRPHAVPLAPQAAGLFGSLPRTGSKVFWNGRTGKVINKSNLASILERLGYKGRMSIHGFRAMASTTLNGLGFNGDWIELQLAHAGRGVRAVYNFADHLAERRAMMIAWADHLDSLIVD